MNNNNTADVCTQCPYYLIGACNNAGDSEAIQHCPDYKEQQFVQTIKDVVQKINRQLSDMGEPFRIYAIYDTLTPKDILLQVKPMSQRFVKTGWLSLNSDGVEFIDKYFNEVGITTILNDNKSIIFPQYKE